MDIQPREGWPAIIEEQGLVFWRTPLPNGEEISYWHEGAYYSLTEPEVYDIEASARLILNDLLIPAGDFIIEHNLFSRMGIPGWAVPRIKETWESEPPMVYGRYDFAYGADGVPKLLEFNADTPTALLESAAIQWHWAVDVFGDGVDQWNTLHEALVARWKELHAAGRLPGDRVHVLHTSAEDSGEDFMCVAYMAEVLKQAGITSDVMPVEQVGWLHGRFVDLANDPIRTAFKLYPWEWMVHEEFADHIMETMGDGPGQTTWIEPIWKMLWSNKGILPVLWHLFPDHPNLLPTYFADEAGEAIDVFGHTLRDTTEIANYVKKPLLAREGANAEIVVGGKTLERGPDQDYGEEGFVYQAFTDLGSYGDARAHPVLGVWTVDMEPVGLGIRESDSLITNNLSRFVPHVID